MEEFIYHSSKPLRLDQYLAEVCPSLSVGLMHKFLRQNKIKLNGKKQPLSCKLQQGDVIRLFLPPAPPQPLTVLYEDQNLIAVYKPAGTPSLGTAESMLQLLQQHKSNGLTTNEEAAFPALCHRLDTGTSGVLLAAKNQPTLDFIEDLLFKRLLQKKYYAVTFGHPAPAAGALESWLAKDAKEGRVFVHPEPQKGTKPIVTAYKTVAKQGPLALLLVSPKTGRTHQIRAHLASVGTPILGDSKYGNNTANRQYHCRYQCLCAWQVTFPSIADGPFIHYSGLQIACEMPWFYTAVTEGTLT